MGVNKCAIEKEIMEVTLKPDSQTQLSSQKFLGLSVHLSCEGSGSARLGKCGWAVLSASAGKQASCNGLLIASGNLMVKVRDAANMLA